MAALPGNKISISDLSALAGLANGKSSLSKNVSPLYTDGSGQPYGYKTFSGVAVDPLHPGTGYKVGDALTLGFGSIFAVAQVSTTGAVLGIRVVNSGQGQYNDPTWNGTSGTQIANGGGSGTGCQLLNTFTHVGPTANYSFPDFSPTDGGITGFYLVDGGTGYTNGDTLTVNFSIWTASTLTVASVDGAGKILTFTLAALGSPVLPATVPQNVASVGATGGTGSGAKVGAYFTLNPNPNWLTELNRMRGDLAAYININYNSGNTVILSISNQWPVSGFSSLYQNVDFYFADPGYAVSATISDSLTGYASGKFTTVNTSISGFGSPFQLGDSSTYECVVGGNTLASLAADFYVLCYVWTGTDGVDPLTLVSIDTSNWPFGSWSKFILPGTPNTVVLYCSFSGAAPPGRYGIKVTGTVYADSSKTWVYLQDGGSSNIGKMGTASYGTINVSPHLLGTGCGSLSVAYSSATYVHGIHDSKNIKKIHLGDTLPPCFYWVNNSILSWDYGGYGIPGPLSNPVFGMEFLVSTSVSITTTVDGLWAACTPMVSSLNAVTPAQMPWNLQRTKYGSIDNATVNPSLIGDLAANISNVAKISNSYDQFLPVELQAEPPGWIANRYFTEGFTIMDGNGNLQICGRTGISGATAPSWGSSDGEYTVEPYGSDPRYNLGWACVQALTSTGSWSAGAAISSGQTIKDSNGNTQYCTSAGTTGSIVPTWPTRVGVSTTDGTVQWQMRCPFTPAIHRPQSIPVYPFYWQGDSTLPTTWVAATAYALNATVIDANGNTQKCTTAGTSAATAPVWSQTLAGVTSDGSTLKWTLLTLAAETNAFLKPPTATSGLTRWGANNQWQRNTYHSPSYDAGWQQDNLAFGWWIYSVSLNRINAVLKTVNGIGAGDAGIGAGDTGVDASGVSGSEVNVTIGCMRNGAFVAFGTWATGQTIQVLWPVFTSDALVYQCGERIDLQAVAISSGGAGVSVGATAAGYPMCAAFVSDTTQLLNLIT
jgi:hypothetical protein